MVYMQVCIPVYTWLYFPHHFACIHVGRQVFEVYLKFIWQGLPYSRKLSREKTFVNFAVFNESFSMKFWGGKSNQSAKVFFVKIVLFTNSRKFLPRKFSTIQHSTGLLWSMEHAFSVIFRLCRRLVWTFNILVHDRNATYKSNASVLNFPL